MWSTCDLCGHHVWRRLEKINFIDKSQINQISLVTFEVMSLGLVKYRCFEWSYCICLQGNIKEYLIIILNFNFERLSQRWALSTVFWNVTSCSLAEIYRCYGGMYYLQLQYRRKHVSFETFLSFYYSTPHHVATIFMSQVFYSWYVGYNLSLLFVRCVIVRICCLTLMKTIQPDSHVVRTRIQ
jgi:hypothetical protein